MRLTSPATPLFLVVLVAATARAGVVVNEVFYNAPDDLDDVQWIELHNPGDGPADVAGWTLDAGRLFTFPAGAAIAPNGYVVVALDPAAFEKSYGSKALGPMKRALKRGGERIELRDGAGGAVDAVRYKDESPWPLSADGSSASLERICPAAPGDVAQNWAASPLPEVRKPAGTPGAANAALSRTLPPVVAVEDAPALIEPGESLPVRAGVKSAGAVREVVLLYRVKTVEGEGQEAALPMAKGADGRYVATIPAQAAGALIRYRVKAVAEDGATRLEPGANDVRPTRSTFVHGPWEPAPIALGMLMLGGAQQTAPEERGPGRRGGFGPQGGLPPGGPRGESRRGGPPGGGFMGGFFGGGEESRPRPPRGAAAFVFVDQKTGKAELFDYVDAVPRSRKPGYKLYFNKDRPLRGMTAVSLVFEGNELSLLIEALAYDVYRRAGNAAPLTEFARLWIDGRPEGYHLIVERPNKAFLRRNKVDDGGHLYKARWFGQGVVGQHVKKTRAHEGHDGLLSVIDLLQKSRNDPDAQWAVIREHFDVEQMATHYAANMVLSHWDGFFNNFYTYHDTKRGKWQMYPWDHDKTWGLTDDRGDRPLVDIPLNFGMDGATPPGGGGGRGGFFGGGGPFGGGPGWWRPPGHFSGPLLANPHFRKVFLDRTRAILRDVYTEAVYVPLIDDLVARLGDDAAIRAEARGGTPGEGRRTLARSAEYLKTHLRERRKFLLAQEELRGK